MYSLYHDKSPRSRTELLDVSQSHIILVLQRTAEEADESLPQPEGISSSCGEDFSYPNTASFGLPCTTKGIGLWKIGPECACTYKLAAVSR